MQRHAALRLDVLELVDGGEVAIGQHGIGQRPQMFGGLQLGGVGREKEQVDVLRDTQPHAAMPPCPVQDEHDLFVRTGSHLLSKGR